ncbi:hypothetical protein [Streptomyces sp. NBC_01198]|uniref:hypothetical protein n=1 Tax=Streptomyces sp. NBC_01198 TaxID=2903769 RepID=UPI002E0D2BAF|nr:hypothetical protein OG702_32235 [Streptomyces sp. NBC_01198]
MSRETDGWEYVNGEARWAPTVEVAMANILVSKYGEEYDQARKELEYLVRAAQRDAAEKLYEESCREELDLGQCIGFQKAADTILPNYPKVDE